MDKILTTIKKIIPKKLFKALQPFYHFVMSWLAALVFWFPGKQLIVIGVTGTTGKTTVVYMIAKMLASAGYKVGYTSTAMFNDGQAEWLNDKKMTMVGRFFTQRILRRMVKNKCQFAIVETTSEGVVQFRHQFINYDILVFTGLYPEHIEAHGSFEKYKEAKGRLFAHLKSCSAKYVDDNKLVCQPKTNFKKIDLNRVKKTIIANGDDDNADYFLDFWAEEKYEFRIKNLESRIKKNINKDVKIIYAEDVMTNIKGVGFKIEGKDINLNLLGEFNLANALAAISVGLSQGIVMEKIKIGLEGITGLPGRLEKIDEGQNFTVIVDYAFEPRAMEKLYESIKNIEHNKIIHVLGSTGGGRDIARRPILGKLAGEKAGFVIVTNEDPYEDDPQIIIDQVALGAEKAGKVLNENLYKIFDRQEAIDKAIWLASEGDIVLVTGKGCEQAICVADGGKIKWDDREAVRKSLKLLNNL